MSCECCRRCCCQEWSEWGPEEKGGGILLFAARVGGRRDVSGTVGSRGGLFVTKGMWRDWPRRHTVEALGRANLHFPCSKPEHPRAVDHSQPGISHNHRLIELARRPATSWRGHQPHCDARRQVLIKFSNLLCPSQLLPAWLHGSSLGALEVCLGKVSLHPLRNRRIRTGAKRPAVPTRLQLPCLFVGSEHLSRTNVA